MMDEHDTAPAAPYARLRAELAEAQAKLEEYAEIDRILNMPDDDILAEMRAQGIDPEQHAAKMRTDFNVIARLTRQNEKLRRMVTTGWMRTVEYTKCHKAERLALLAELAAARAVLRELRAVARCAGRGYSRND